jgi:large subunit ribosomal protein L25
MARSAEGRVHCPAVRFAPGGLPVRPSCRETSFSKQIPQQAKVHPAMELVLTADSTRQTGTRPSRRLRREGRIPAVVYGMGSEPVAVSVDWRELRQCLKTDAGINAVIELDIDGVRHTSIVKDLQRHPVRRDVTHIDFLRVDPLKPVTVEVPVVLVGEAKQVANMQGVVDQQLFRVSVSVRPDTIPNELEIDISDLDIGDVITVGQLKLPAGVTAVSDADATVVQGLATRSTIVLRQGGDPDALPLEGEEAPAADAEAEASAEAAGDDAGASDGAADDAASDE